MIQNLNQINFQAYGNIVPSRKNAENLGEITQYFTVIPENDTICVYRATAPMQMYISSGKCVLCISLDGENFRHFYFDKPVCIKNDVYFYFAPFKGEAVISVIAKSEAAVIGKRASENFRMDQHLHIPGIYTFFYQEKEQGFVFPGEEHPTPELTYVDQGELHSVADGQDILLKAGDIAIFGPNQWHMQYADVGVAPRFVTISFDMDGADIAPLLNRKFTAPQQATSLIQQMLQEQERMDDFSTDMIIAHLTTLLLLLLRQADSPAIKLRSSNAVHSENEIIRRAQQYIGNHIREKLSVPILAQKVGVSPSYLTALFHKNLQISPGEYIRRIKLQESKQMIRENSMNFTEIAQALQYSTVHHFSRQFKKKFGLTPSEYARSVR